MLSKMKMDVIHATRANSYSPYRATRHTFLETLYRTLMMRGVHFEMIYQSNLG